MAILEAQIDSANEVFPAETDRNTTEYAEELGLTVKQLITLIKDRDVMDLGSGVGVFAAEMYYWKSLGYPTPSKVDSVNLRFAAPDYQDFLKNQIYKNNPQKKLLKPPRKLDFHFFGQDKKRQTAWQEAQKHFLGLDWNNLSEVEDGSYDVIISIHGFPRYSDLKYTKPESPEEYDAQTALGTAFKFGEQSKQVFKSLTRILRPGGVALLSTPFPQGGWERSPKFREEITIFFANLGCELEVIPTTEIFSLLIKKLIEKPATEMSNK